MKENCKRCKFWVCHGARDIPQEAQDHFGLPATEEEGRCRRYPPVFLGSNEDDIRMAGHDQDEWGFPIMSEIEWCGEFLPSNK